MKNPKIGHNGQDYQELPQNLISLRLPIFCGINKPYMFININTMNEKYRISLSPEFLKVYDLSFQIFRDESLNNLLSNQNIQNNKFLILSQKSEPKRTGLYLRLPKMNKLQISKQTMIFEDILGEPDSIFIMDKYHCEIDSKKTLIIISERYHSGKKNTSVTFISEKYKNISSFLLDYSKLF